MEEYDIFWFEEPCPPDNLRAIKEVKESSKIPVVTGEALYTIHAFREIIENRSVDIINPDVCNTGGILELSQIASMSQIQYIPVSPHGWNSTSIGFAAGLQASATMKNFLIYEYMISVEKSSEDISIGYIKP